MAVHAATATTTAGATGVLLAILTAVTLCYLLACWLYPFSACHRCRGSGKRRSPLGGRSFRLCPRCHGTGRRLRIGRHVMNYLRERRDKGGVR
jgi:hypothetical protein